MEGLWVLPTFIDVGRYNMALGKALSFFSPAAGRLRRLPNKEDGRPGETYIRLTNSGIPVSVVDNYELESFPIPDETVCE